MIIGISGKINSGKDLFAKLFKRCEMIQRIERGEFSACHSQVLEYVEKTQEPFFGPNSWKIKKFAGKLKQHVASLLGINENLLEDRDFKNSLLGSEWKVFEVKDIGNRIDPVVYLSHERAEMFLDAQKAAIPYLNLIIEAKRITVRELLIAVGHQSRVNIHPDIWVNGLFADYKEEKRKVIIDDSEEYQNVLPNWLVTDVRYPNEKERIERLGGIVIRIESPHCQIIDHPSETGLDGAKFNFTIENNYHLEDFNSQVEELYAHLIVH